jgi:hypothetical protein
MSSSAALTGAFSMGLSSLFDLHLTLPQLAEVDFGEYYLGSVLYLWLVVCCLVLTFSSSFFRYF